MKIAILRRPEGLFSLRVEAEEVTQLGDEPLAARMAWKESVEPLVAEEIDYRPFSAVIMRSVTHLRLAKANANTLVAIWHVLVNSVPDAVAFEFEFPGAANLAKPIKPARTAAHPRGFQGTKHQPPSGRGAQAINWLEFLDGGRNEAAALQALAAFREEAELQIEQEAAYGESLSGQPQCSLRPFGQAWRPQDYQRVARLPAWFQRHFLWSQRGFDMKSIGSLHQALLSLGLPLERDLLKLLACFVKKNLTNHLNWLRALLSVAPRRRVTFVECALAHDWLSTLDESWLGPLVEFESLASDSNYRARLKFVLAGILADQSAEAILVGMRLANDYDPDFYFRVGHWGSSREQELRRVIRATQSEDEIGSRAGVALALWRADYALPNFLEVLNLEWVALEPEHAEELVGAFVYMMDFEPEDEDPKAKGEVLMSCAPAMLAAVLRCDSSYRTKAIGNFSETVCMRDKPEQLGPALDLAARWNERTARAPFSTKRLGWGVLHALIELSFEHTAEWLGMPESGIHRFEKSCARQNDAYLIGEGLGELADLHSELLSDGLLHAHNAVLACAKALGCLHADERDRFLRRMYSEDLFRIDWEGLDTRALVLLLEGANAPAARSLIPASLKPCIAGSAPWPEGREAFLRKKLLAAESAVKLSRIEAAVVEQVASNLNLPAAPTNSMERHALLLHLSVAENRRMLRGALQARFSGKPDRRNQHPLNRKWVAEHPEIVMEHWLAGVPFERATGEWGPIRIYIEQDLLQVLRLGTVVGSCLGLGGGHTYSAAAIAYDINKQVAFAADERGRILGRQVIALSKSSRLFCFEVYGNPHSDALKALFFEFDREFAARLGVELHDPDDNPDDNPDDDSEGGTSGDEEEIETLVSRTWWDDGAIKVPLDAPRDAGE